MRKRLSLADVVEKNKIASANAFIALLEVQVIDPANGSLVETLYVANNSEDVIYGGNTYVQMVFDIQVKAEAGAAPTVTLNVNDYSQAVMGRMQAYGGGIGFNVKLIIVNSGDLTQPSELEETFEVIGANASNYSVSWTLGAESTLTTIFPRRNQLKDRCTWKYKGTECGYVGALTSCDLSLQGANGCTAHSNSDRFGGCPGINISNVRYG